MWHLSMTTAAFEKPWPPVPFLSKDGRGRRAGSSTATIIAAPSSIKNAEDPRPRGCAKNRKGRQWYFGMNLHVRRARVELA